MKEQRHNIKDTYAHNVECDWDGTEVRFNFTTEGKARDGEIIYKVFHVTMKAGAFASLARRGLRAVLEARTESLRDWQGRLRRLGE